MKTTLNIRLILSILVLFQLGNGLSRSFAVQQAAALAARDAKADAPAEAKADAAAKQPSVQPVADPPAKVEAPTVESKTKTILVNEKQLRFTVPTTWQQVEPRNRLVEVEFAILPQELADASEDETTTEPAANTTEAEALTAEPVGRLTMMSAGGDVDANIRRWVGQFRLGRDAGGKDAMRRDRRPLRGAVAHVLDIAGTFFDSPKGPLGPKVELPNYRMLGAIIEVESAGKYFVKFYGPAEIVDENAEAFAAMLEQLEVVPSGEDPLEADTTTGEVNTPAQPKPNANQSAAIKVEAQG